MDVGNRLTLTRRALMAGTAAALAATRLPVARADAPQKLKLLLDWYINPNHAPLLIAQETGAFAAVGLEVEIVEPADPNDPPKLIAAGQGDIAISYQPQLMMQIDQGLPLARIGVLVDSPLNMLLALGGGAIASMGDLKGKKIGYSVGGFEDALLSTMLKTAGLTLQDVELVNVNFALAQSLLSGAADAVIGAYRNYELNILAMEGKAPLPFFVEDYGVPSYDELIFIANKSNAAQASYGRFLDAVQSGIAFMMNRPDDAWQLFTKGRSQLDDELNRRAFHDTLRRFSHSPASADAQRYDRFGAYLRSLGIIKQVRPSSDYLVRPGA